MSATRVAVRYARALIEALSEKNAIDQADPFLSFCTLVSGNDELSRLFANVTVPAETKTAIVAELAKKLALPPMIANFLRIAAANGRLGILPEIAAATATALDDHRNIKAVHLTTATEPSGEELAAFEAAMKQKLGTEIRVESTTDPAILGGAIARVGSTVYDGSVAAQLTRLRRELIEEN